MLNFRHSFLCCDGQSVGVAIFKIFFDFHQSFSVDGATFPAAAVSFWKEILRGWWELTQSADGAAVGLVAQSVCAGVAETQVSARQDEGVSHIRQTHHTLSTVVTDLIVSNLEI